MDDDLLEKLSCCRGDYFFIKDKNSIFLEVNDRFAKLYPARKRKQLIGTDALEDYPPEWRDRFLEGDHITISEGYSQAIEKISYPNSRIVMAFTRKFRFRTHTTKETYILGIVDDLSVEEQTLRKVSLTRRERDCLSWIARGRSAWEISEILGIAERTVEFHLENSRKKLGAKNTVHAVALACRYLDL